jgi:hypothetical protein
MSAFSAALATLHADPNMSAAATYSPKAGASAAVRIVWRPRGNTDYGPFEVRASVPAYQAEVLASALANDPVEGDLLRVDGVNYKVRKAERDGEQLTWLLDLDRLS